MKTIYAMHMIVRQLQAKIFLLLLLILLFGNIPHAAQSCPVGVIVDRSDKDKDKDKKDDEEEDEEDPPPPSGGERAGFVKRVVDVAESARSVEEARRIIESALTKEPVKTMESNTAVEDIKPEGNIKDAKTVHADDISKKVESAQPVVVPSRAESPSASAPVKAADSKGK